MIRSYIRSFLEISKELPILDLERVEEVPPKSQQSQGGGHPGTMSTNPGLEVIHQVAEILKDFPGHWNNWNNWNNWQGSFQLAWENPC